MIADDSETDTLDRLTDALVTQEALHRVRDGDRLMDEEMNAFFKLLAQRSATIQSFPRVHCFSTFFLPSIEKAGGLERLVQRQGRLEDLFTFEVLLFPIHVACKEHWCLIEVRPKMMRIQYLDSSLITSGESECAHIIKFFQLLQHKRIEANRWTVLTSQDIPHQTNGQDCGVFVCQMAERLSRNASLDFTASDIPRLRNQMARELASGSMTVMQLSPRSEVIHLKQAIDQLRRQKEESERIAELKSEELARELRESQAKEKRLKEQLQELNNLIGFLKVSGVESSTRPKTPPRMESVEVQTIEFETPRLIIQMPSSPEAANAPREIRHREFLKASRELDLDAYELKKKQMRYNTPKPVNSVVPMQRDTLPAQIPFTQPPHPPPTQPPLPPPPPQFPNQFEIQFQFPQSVRASLENGDGGVNRRRPSRAYYLPEFNVETRLGAFLHWARERNIDFRGELIEGAMRDLMLRREFLTTGVLELHHENFVIARIPPFSNTAHLNLRSLVALSLFYYPNFALALIYCYSGLTRRAILNLLARVFHNN